MRYSWKPLRGIFKNTDMSEVIKLGAAIATLTIAIYGLRSCVETLVDNRLKDREFIEKMAKSIRPSMIFNSKESIIADLGDSEHIESIKIIKYEDKKKIYQ